MASKQGAEDDPAFQEAYWEAFARFFGRNNARTVKAMLLVKNPEGDTGKGELDRVCFGLRQTMSWVAEAIEREALKASGHALVKS